MFDQPKQRILVLDDNPQRLNVFAQWFKDHDVVLTNCYGDCIQAFLSNERFDLVHLDHDLNDFGNKSTMPSMYGGGASELTGADVAWFIAYELPESKRPSKVVIHSWNPDGAKAMYDILSSLILTIRAPFEPPKGWNDQIEQIDLRE